MTPASRLLLSTPRREPWSRATGREEAGELPRGRAAAPKTAHSASCRPLQRPAHSASCCNAEVLHEAELALVREERGKDRMAEEVARQKQEMIDVCFELHAAQQASACLSA